MMRFPTVHSNMHRVGGISAFDMNQPELDLLFNLDFRLKVNLETFGSCCLQLEKHAAVSLEIAGSGSLCQWMKRFKL
uniref:Uncharacterized protein n=1 Tax=Triticum urartu TaxID=4572 RepID=A0A8R7P7K0_TRIUA